MNNITHISSLQSNVVNFITKGSPKLSTGLKELDMKLYGFETGDFVLVAGRPSMGKTALCIQFALGIAKKSEVLFISLETSGVQLFTRMISHLSGQSFYEMKSGEVSFENVQPFISKISKKHLYLYDKSGVNCEFIKNVLKEQKFDCIFIDYLQLLGGFGEGYERISTISRNLQSIAHDTKVPIIAISQLSRAPEMRENNRPRLSDLRESGSLEQDADKVLLLYRPEYYQKGDNLQEDDIGCAEIIVAKNRSGATGVVKVKWIPETMSFKEYNLKF